MHRKLPLAVKQSGSDVGEPAFLAEIKLVNLNPVIISHSRCITIIVIEQNNPTHLFTTSLNLLFYIPRYYLCKASNY